jgi:hypothetical protein
MYKKFRIKFRYEETGEAIVWGDTKDDAVKSLSTHLKNIGTEELNYQFIDNDCVIKEVAELEVKNVE